MSPASSLLETMDGEVAALYAKSKDAIVRIHAEAGKSLARCALGPAHRVGTGFFIDTDGRLVTAAALIEGANSIWIDWQGRHVPAKLLGHDPLTKLAVLQVDPAQCVAAGQALPALICGDSSGLQIGSMVVAIGFPYEQPSMPVVGFVTGLDINCGKHIFPVSHIRAGCRLRPGQGGGPLLNARGEVVGVIVAAHAEDQCYGLPVNALKKICADIIDHGEPQYGWVGLDVTEHQLTNSLGQWQVIVQAVLSNTPAATAGFARYDVVLRICSNDIRRAADVLNTMFYQRSGQMIRIAVLRDGATQDLAVAVGKRPEVQPIANAAPLIVPEK